MSMVGMNSYLNSYVDRRMKYIIEEWDLSTRNDLSDFTGRLDALEREIPRLKSFEQAAADKLTELENRARKLKERV
jgi:polyhydroxyalkanoate synthesis regulator phasin